MKQTCPKRANLGLLLSAAVLALTTVSGHGAVISGAGGDSKANATVITLAELAVGVSCPGNTLGADNSFFNPASPSLPFAYNGPDLWFTFTTTTSLTLLASLDLPGSTGDLVLFLLGTGGTNADVLGNSPDQIGPGAGPEILPEITLTAGTYFLVIDSFFAAPHAQSAGTFKLNIAPVAGIPEPHLAGFASMSLVLMSLARGRIRNC